MPSLISAWNTYIESCSPSQLQYCYLTLGSIPSWIGFLWKAPDPYLNETNHWGQNKKVVQGWIHIWWKQPFRQNKKVVDGGVCQNGGRLGLFSTIYFDLILQNVELDRNISSRLLKDFRAQQYLFICDKAGVRSRLMMTKPFICSYIRFPAALPTSSLYNFFSPQTNIKKTNEEKK